MRYLRDSPSMILLVPPGLHNQILTGLEPPLQQEKKRYSRSYYCIARRIKLNCVKSSVKAFNFMLKDVGSLEDIIIRIM